MYQMRRKSRLIPAFLLLGLCLSMVAPSSLQLCVGHDAPVIVTLDVCHTGDGGMQAGTKIPFLHENVFANPEKVFVQSLDIPSDIIIQLLLSSDKSRPPRS